MVVRCDQLKKKAPDREGLAPTSRVAPLFDRFLDREIARFRQSGFYHTEPHETHGQGLWVFVLAESSTLNGMEVSKKSVVRGSQDVVVWSV